MRTCIVGLILANMALVSSQPRGMGRGSLMVRGVRKLDEDKMNEGGMGQMAGKGDPKGILAAEGTHIILGRALCFSLLSGNTD